MLGDSFEHTRLMGGLMDVFALAMKQGRALHIIFAVLFLAFFILSWKFEYLRRGKVVATCFAVHYLYILFYLLSSFSVILFHV